MWFSLLGAMLITNTFYDQQDRVMDQLEHDKILFYRYLKGLSEHLLEGTEFYQTIAFFLSFFMSVIEILE